jgi:hypothetical protein
MNRSLRQDKAGSVRKPLSLKGLNNKKSREIWHTTRNESEEARPHGKDLSC